MRLLERKTAIITGASRGIGRCLAKTFSAHGCNVAFTYNSNKDAAENLVADLKDSNVTIKAYQSNAAHFKAAQELVAKILEDFGSVDILLSLIHI